MTDFPSALSNAFKADVRIPGVPFERLPNELLLQMLVFLDPSCKKILKLREVNPRWQFIIENNIEFLYRNLRSTHPELLLPEIKWKGTPHERFLQFLYECTLGEKLRALKRSSFYHHNRFQVYKLTGAAEYPDMPEILRSYLYYIRNGVDRKTALHYARILGKKFDVPEGTILTRFPKDFDSTRYATPFPLAALQRAKEIGGVTHNDEWKDRLLALGPRATNEEILARDEDDDDMFLALDEHAKPQHWQPDQPEARNVAEPTAVQLLAETAEYLGVPLEFLKPSDAS